jgi:hypothetical protein
VKKKTQQQMRIILRRMQACEEATEWVLRQKNMTTAWRRCRNASWIGLYITDVHDYLPQDSIAAKTLLRRSIKMCLDLLSLYVGKVPTKLKPYHDLLVKWHEKPSSVTNEELNDAGNNGYAMLSGAAAADATNSIRRKKFYT